MRQKHIFSGRTPGVALAWGPEGAAGRPPGQTRSPRPYLVLDIKAGAFHK